MIRIAGVDVRYGRTQALQGIGINVNRGITVVVGPNGAGKTTLLRLLATALDPESGSISILGRNPRRPQDRTEIRRQLGFVPQDTDTNASRMTVGELIDYLAVLKGYDDPRQRLNAVADVVADHGLLPVLESRIEELSAGVRRRVLLAQAFLGKPRLLVLDEPFIDLDPEQRRAAERQIAATRDHASVIVATHDIDEFVAASDTVVILREGQLRFVGTPAELCGRAFAVPEPGAAQPNTQTMRAAYIAATSS